MDQDFLSYYNDELSHLRQAGAEFAEAYPKIAGRIRLTEGGSDDPHVARLLESFAFLAARLRLKLDDDFSSIAAALLDLLYPHFLAPVPSASVFQLQLDKEQADLVAGLSIARGAELTTEAIEDIECVFRTSCDVRLWPLTVRGASYQGRPFTAPAAPGEAEAVLRIDLERFGGEAPIAELELDRLTMYLADASSRVFELYEALFTDVEAVVVADDEQDESPDVLRPPPIHPVGFAAEERLLEDGPQSHRGYTLLTEFFTFPRKFLFFETAGLRAALKRRRGPRASLFFMLKRHRGGLDREVGPASFQLGCTPAVNQFERRAEPIRWTGRRSRYLVVPDVRRRHGAEVQRVLQVNAVRPTGESFPCEPLFRVGGERGEALYWKASREASYARGGPPSQVYLTFADSDVPDDIAGGLTLDVRTLCLNGRLPEQVPFGGGRPRVKLQAAGPVSAAKCLTPISPRRDAPRQSDMLWMLTSHLSLNHLSLVDGPNGAEALRALLRLYDRVGGDETAAMIAGIDSVSTRRVAARVGSAGRAAVCRGAEVTMRLDETKFAGGGSFLFAAVLERFLALYANVNSFTQLAATSRQRRGEIHRWPPRSGETPLI